MVEVAILTGGNVGDVRGRLAQARELIGERVGEVVSASELHSSAAWGFRSADEFWNQVLVVRTALLPQPLLEALQCIENELGRDRAAEAALKAATGERYVSRAIDIDILLYGSERVATPLLQIPHPLIAEREFVMVPLCEALGISRQELLKML